MISIGLFHSTIRGDEKLIIKAAKKRKVNLKLYDIRNLILEKSFFPFDFDIALNRSVSNTKGRYLTAFLESCGIKVVNSLSVTQNCEDKFFTSLLLKKNNVPTIPFAIVFSLSQALEFVESVGGFPVVIKPTLGSWGRLLAKVNDKDALEAIIEHKNHFTSPHHQAFYIQKYVDKNGRDIRAFCVGNNVIAAIYRKSSHWITNTARGGKTFNCPINRDLELICQKASLAVGGGILAMDIFETKEGYLINEINHTMEFKNSEEPTGVSISGAIIDYCIDLFQKNKI